MDQSGFMHQYYDWAAFENFVKELHEGDGDVTVMRNVTDVDRTGAKRQTDVKIIRRSRFQEFTTLIECKRWKEPVGRDRIDVLAASIDALAANAGAIFTTSGFEEGAIAYAKGKGIELFVVRDLTPEEWGLPGRHVSINLHVNAAEFRNIGFAAQAIPLVDQPPKNPNINIELSPKNALDPELDLFSVKTGERGPNLVGILSDLHAMLLSDVGSAVGLFDGGAHLTLEIIVPCELDLTRTEFCQLRLPAFAARVERIGFNFVAHICQSQINIDRGAQLDFAVMVESYVSTKRVMAHRRSDESNIAFQNIAKLASAPQVAEQPIQNGSLMRVVCQPWVGLAGAKAQRSAMAQGGLIRALLVTEEKKPRLILRSAKQPAPAT